jgi:hypothetical protein
VITLHLRFTQGHGWYIVQRNPDAVFASTGTNERVVAGPYTGRYEAENECLRMRALLRLRPTNNQREASRWA